MVILDLWGIVFHAVVVFGLGKDFLFKSILGRCELHTSLLNFHSIAYYERSFGFFCLLVSVFLLIFVHIVIPRNVGSYPVIVITRLGAIDFMLITFISRSSKIKNFICAKFLLDPKIICVIE